MSKYTLGPLTAELDMLYANGYPIAMTLGNFNTTKTNAARLAFCWNLHDDLLKAVQHVLQVADAVNSLNYIHGRNTKNNLVLSERYGPGERPGGSYAKLDLELLRMAVAQIEKTDVDVKKKLIDIVKNARGNKLERTEHEFEKYTPGQLQEEYGRSGLTRQQLLDDYRQEREEWQAAYDFVCR